MHQCLIVVFACILFPPAGITQSNSGIPTAETGFAADTPLPVLAAAAERLAEASDLAASSELARRANVGLGERAALGADVFYVCVRMARIARQAPQFADELAQCLNAAKEWTIAAEAPDGGSYDIGYLPVRLAEALAEMGDDPSARDLTLFAMNQVWPGLASGARIALGRAYIRAAQRFGLEAEAAMICLEVLDDLQLGDDRSLDGLWAILVPEYDCLASLPDERARRLAEALEGTFDGLAETGTESGSATGLVAAVTYQQVHGYAASFAGVLRAATGEECASSSPGLCVLGRALDGLTADEVPADAYPFATQVFVLALQVGTPEQQDVARGAYEQSLRALLAAGPAIETERRVHRSIARLEAEFGAADRAAEIYLPYAPLRDANRWEDLPAVLEIARALDDEGQTDRAVQFLEVMLPWRDTPSALFGGGPGEGDLLWGDFIAIARFYHVVNRPDRAREILVLGIQAAPDPGAAIAIGQAQMALGFASDAPASFGVALGLSETVPGAFSDAALRSIVDASQLAPAAAPPELMPPYLWPDAQLFWDSPVYILY